MFGRNHLTRNCLASGAGYHSSQSVTPMDSATVDYLYGLQIVSYFDAAFFTFLTWDTVANFGNEYTYIWRSPSSFIKFLYLWTRYGTFFDTLLPILRWNVAIGASSCLIVSKFQGIFTAFGIAITEAILMVRTYALYERSKKLVVFFCVMWLSIVGVSLWAAIHWTESGLQLGEGGGLVCLNSYRSSNVVFVTYGSLLFGETVIVLLTLRKAIQTWSLTVSRYHPSRLVVNFYRDGIIYYFAMLGIVSIDCL
ncbi:hypothetical protein B0H16DRAFT_888790 [Mycena metata]|uniref:DUF6533 domain-containing protein n=1 Tax=Mycena metata TaxID=1033252 RepID=A0AAD7NWV3_9AGAR|nr:hypothetical protein B0H16DRAFT_888790 [Mycena metata]